MTLHRGPGLHVPEYDHTQTLAHQKPDELPKGVYTVKGQYIWDSWIVEDEGVLHRYALSASIEYTPNERHQHSFVRHAISRDQGDSWEDIGPAITPTARSTWPDHVIWTSSVLLRKDRPEGKEFLMFVTGRSMKDGWTQKIGLCRSADGYTFDEPRLILAPQERLGYDTTDDDGIIMAWRDPKVLRHPETGQWHMFFSAKMRSEDGTPHPTVGHAIATSDALDEWELQPPLRLPHYYAQLEVPYMIYRDGKFYLFVSTQNFPLKDNNRDKQANYRGYRSDNIRGPWDFVYGHEEALFGHKIYAPTLFELPWGSGNYYAVSFFSSDTPHPLTGTPIIPLEWKGDEPEFRFRSALRDSLQEPQ